MASFVGLSGLPGLEPLTGTPCPPVQGAPPSQSNSAHLQEEEDRAVVPDRLHVEAQVSESVDVKMTQTA